MSSRLSPVSMFTTAMLAGCVLAGLPNVAAAATGLKFSENANVLADAANLSLLELPVSALGATSLTLGNVSISMQISGVKGGIVQGDMINAYAAPSVDPAGNAYTGAYFSTGLGTITLSFSQTQDELGLLWGSVDAENTLSFYNGDALVGRIGGADVIAHASTAITAANSEYVTMLVEPFDTVTLTSTKPSFEALIYTNTATTNGEIAIVSSAVPEPASVALFGLALLSLGGAIAGRRSAQPRR